MDLMKWPLYKEKLVVVRNPEGCVGVVTCWTDREWMSKWLSWDAIVAYGNLYSPNRGLDYLIANVLAHPYLQYLVVCGFDRLGGGLALIKLVEDGVEEGVDGSGKDCWLVKGVPNGRVSKDFSREDLEYFRKTVVVRDQRWGGPDHGADLLRDWFASFVMGDVNWSERAKERPLVAREPRRISITEVTASKTFPHFPAGHTITGRTVAEVWLKILDFIVKFGPVSNTQYQSMQQEHLVLTSVITEENPYALTIPSWFPFDAEWFAKYLPTVIEPVAVPQGVSYYYGDRLRIRWGDQLGRLIEKLRSSPETRQGVMSLWDPEGDLMVKEPPCLNYLWCRVQSGEFCLHAVIRSNDMFRAYPANALAMRMLQETIRREAVPQVRLGPLLITSDSAHIYDESWDAAGRIIDQYKDKIVADERNIIDSSGIFLLSVREGEIFVEHLLPTGEAVQSFHGRTALSLYLQLQDFVSITEHALYLGAELQKAEIALKLGIPYTQDKALAIEKAV